jgi:hypothetical protein
MQKQPITFRETPTIDCSAVAMIRVNRKSFSADFFYMGAQVPYKDTDVELKKYRNLGVMCWYLIIGFADNAGC